MDEDVRQFECRLSDQGRTYQQERREVMRQCRRDSDTGRRIGDSTKDRRRIGDSTGFSTYGGGSRALPRRGKAPNPVGTRGNTILEAV